MAEPNLLQRFLRTIAAPLGLAAGAALPAVAQAEAPEASPTSSQGIGEPKTDHIKVEENGVINLSGEALVEKLAQENRMVMIMDTWHPSIEMIKKINDYVLAAGKGGADYYFPELPQAWQGKWDEYATSVDKNGDFPSRIDMRADITVAFLKEMLDHGDAIPDDFSGLLMKYSGWAEPGKEGTFVYEGLSGMLDARAKGMNVIFPDLGPYGPEFMNDLLQNTAERNIAMGKFVNEILDADLPDKTSGVMSMGWGHGMFKYDLDEKLGAAMVTVELVQSLEGGEPVVVAGGAGGSDFTIIIEDYTHGLDIPMDEAIILAQISDRQTFSVIAELMENPDFDPEKIAPGVKKGFRPSAYATGSRQPLFKIPIGSFPSPLTGLKSGLTGEVIKDEQDKKDEYEPLMYPYDDPEDHLIAFVIDRDDELVNIYTKEIHLWGKTYENIVFEISNEAERARRHGEYNSQEKRVPNFNTPGKHELYTWVNLTGVISWRGGR